MLTQRLLRYAVLVRFHRPIGIYLLLWPTLWALWLASDGIPSFSYLIIFILGVICMRSAGCIVNDIADRHIDPHVERTRQRPLACHVVSLTEAWCLFALLLMISLVLLLQLNTLAIAYGFFAALLTLLYPLAKRVTYLPQLLLGLTFNGVPIAFAAVNGHFSVLTWWVFASVVIWTVIFDTFYAMADRDDDIKLNVKSTAILFGKYDRFILGLLQIIFIGLLIKIGLLAELTLPYDIAVFLAACQCIYHQVLIADRESSRCFQAFLKSHWLGLTILVGIILNYL